MQAALVLLLSAVMLTAAPKTSAWDQVQAIAKATGHHLTIIPQNGYYHIDMDGSDIAGAGPTIEDAAEDFLGALNMNSEDHGADTKQPEHWKPPVAPPLIKPESRSWI